MVEKVLGLVTISFDHIQAILHESTWGVIYG
jgi:hypothetical protein